ncbi:MAG: hypothetical protein KAY37_12280 [Phycisphaerae bacterium]|nr:hypothetical protein [Phycisphaerae bacterium]
MKKLRLYAAGLVAFLVGMPFTAKVFAEDTGSVGGATGNLVDTLIDASTGYS